MADNSNVFSSFNEETRDFGYGWKDGKPIHCEDDIPVCEADIPMHLKEGQYDVVLVYNEKDKHNALVFKHILEKAVTLEDGQSVQVSTLDPEDGTPDCRNWIQSIFRNVEEAMTRSTFMFLFMTAHFTKDGWTRLLQEECIQHSINDPNKKWCLVPLYSHPKSECPFKIPWGLKSLKGIHINKILKGEKLGDVNSEDVNIENIDRDFIKNVSKLLNSRIVMKVNRKKSQSEALKKFEENLMSERKFKLKQHRQEQEIERLKNEKKFQLMAKTLDSKCQEDIRKIEDMTTSDIPDVSYDIIQEHTPTQTTQTGEFFHLYDLCLKSGMNPAEAIKNAKEICTAKHGPSNIPTKQTIVHIHHTSGVMIGDRNEQHPLSRAQNADVGDTEGSTYSGGVEIERTNGDQGNTYVAPGNPSGPSEGRDDSPKQNGAKSKQRAPVENMEVQVASKDELKSSLSPDVQENVIKYEIPPSPKPVATVPPIRHSDGKSSPLPEGHRTHHSSHYDMDETRVKGLSRSNNTAVKTPVQNQGLEETEVKGVQNVDEDETAVKHMPCGFDTDTIVKEEYVDRDDTFVKGEYLADDTLLKEEFQNDDTLLKEEYRDDNTLSKEEFAVHTVHETFSNDETAVKTIEDEFLQACAEFGSSVDPPHHWASSDDPKLEGDNHLSSDSTLIPSISSDTEKTLVPDV